MSALLTVTCGGCETFAPYPVGVVLVIEQDGVLHLLWPCLVCGPGWQQVSSVDERAVVLRSGAAVRRAAQPTGWPTRVQRPLYQAPLSRLTRRVGRRTNPEETS